MPRSKIKDRSLGYQILFWPYVLPHLGQSWNFSYSEILSNPSLQEKATDGNILCLAPTHPLKSNVWNWEYPNNQWMGNGETIIYLSNQVFDLPQLKSRGSKQNRKLLYMKMTSNGRLHPMETTSKRKWLPMEDGLKINKWHFSLIGSSSNLKLRGPN